MNPRQPTTTQLRRPRPKRLANWCSSCGCDFGSVDLFDRHRVGVHQQIAAHIETLKAQAVTPAVEPVDDEAARLEEEERRNARREDNLRRLKSPVLAQRQPDGSIRFRHDLGIRDDGVRASGQS